MKYWLMHKDDKAAELEFDTDTGKTYDLKVLEKALLPECIDSRAAMKEWWSARAMPLSVKKMADCNMIPDAEEVFEFYKTCLASSSDDGIINNICKGYSFKAEKLKTALNI